MAQWNFCEHGDQPLETQMHAGICICLDFVLAVDRAQGENGHMFYHPKDISCLHFLWGSLLVAKSHWASETKYKMGKVEENFLCSGA